MAGVVVEAVLDAVLLRSHSTGAVAEVAGVVEASMVGFSVDEVQEHYLHNPAGHPCL